MRAGREGEREEISGERQSERARGKDTEKDGLRYREAERD